MNKRADENWHVCTFSRYLVQPWASKAKSGQEITVVHNTSGISTQSGPICKYADKLDSLMDLIPDELIRIAARQHISSQTLLDNLRTFVPRESHDGGLTEAVAHLIDDSTCRVVCYSKIRARIERVLCADVDTLLSIASGARLDIRQERQQSHVKQCSACKDEVQKYRNLLASCLQGED